MSPEGDEVLFKGSMERKGVEGVWFTIRVSKELDGGKWRVSYIGLDKYVVEGNIHRGIGR